MRRCTSDHCLLAATRKSRLFGLDLPVAGVLHSPVREWGAIAHRVGARRIASARRALDVDWKKFNVNDYLFSHCTIVTSVKTADNGYWIDPPCQELVNANGNAWSTPVLLATFKSFIGAENYYEHVQVPELSKGKILDAVLRPVVYVGKDGSKADVYYCDILVATSRIHADIVERVEEGDLTTMSMGCLAHVVQCSKCGKEIEDDGDNCEHLENELMREFVDKNGVRRVVAELCGRSTKKDGQWVGDPASVEFIEASWVEKPAFKGAVLNYMISEPTTKQASILNLSTSKLASLFEDLPHIRVADTDGMMVLRVARAELWRRRQEGLIARVACAR
jgi:hypothetical protein